MRFDLMLKELHATKAGQGKTCEAHVSVVANQTFIGGTLSLSTKDLAMGHVEGLEDWDTKKFILDVHEMRAVAAALLAAANYMESAE